MLERDSHSRVRALSPGFGDVLSALGALDEMFLVVRNEACLMGGLTGSLRYSQVGYRRMAMARDLSLNLSSRFKPVVLAYSEEGSEGEIAGIEFFDRCGRGCMKICRTAAVEEDVWDGLLASLTCGVVARETLSKLRKTNHLNSRSCCEVCRQKREHQIATQPPAAEVREELEDFIDQAIEDGCRLDLDLPCGLLRAQASFFPQEFGWQGQWAYVSAERSGCHLRIAEGSSLRITPKSAGIRTLHLFDDRGCFAAQVVARPTKSFKL